MADPRDTPTADRRARSFRVLWASAVPVAALLLLGLLASPFVPHPGFTMRGDRVIRVEPGAAAATSGMCEGDVLTDAANVRTRLLSGPREVPVDVDVNRGGERLTLAIRATRPHAAEVMRRLLQTLVGFSFVSLGLYVCRRRPDRVGLLFGGFALAFALPLHAPIPAGGGAGSALVTLLDDWAQVILGPILVHFFLHFPQRYRRLGRGLLAILYGPALILGCFALLHAVTALPTALGNALPPMAGLYLTTCLGAAILRFIHAYRTSERRVDRVRLRAMLIGTLAASVPLFLGLLLAGRGPAGTMHLETWSPLFLLAIPLSYAYAIARYQILDLQVMVRRGLLLAALTAAAAALLVTGLVLVERRLELSTISPWILPLATAAGVVALGLLYRRLRGAVDRTFTLERGERMREARAYEESLSTLLNEDRVVASLVETVSRLFDADLAAFYRPGQREDRLTLAEGRGGERRPAPAVAIDRAVREHLLEIRGAVDPGQILALAPSNLRGTMAVRLEDLGFELYVPIHHGERLVGVLALGPPRGRLTFSRRERRSLARLALRAAGALDTARAHEDAVVREKLARDLEVARGIQRRLLPRRAPLRLGIELGAVTLSCDAVGGDFYDFLDFPDGRVGFAVGDVSGKGIGAALLMATVHSALHLEAATAASPAAVLRRLNLSLLDRKETGKFVCLFFAHVDPENRVLTYANAGIEPPVLARGRGGWEVLDQGGLVLGVSADADYPETRVRLESGDRVLVFSDGLMDIEELTGSDAPPAGPETLVEAMGGGRPDVRESLRRVLAARGLTQPGPPPDDATLLLLQAH